MGDEDINEGLDQTNPAEQTLADELNQRFLSTGSILRPDDTSIDDIFREIGRGSFGSQLTAAMYGHDLAGVGTFLEQPKEQHGEVFFTKPRLNLSYDNIYKDRIFTGMASRNPFHPLRIVKAMLDPVSAVMEGLGSPLIDNYNAFIPMLSSTCTAMTGWPDIFMKTYTSRAGNYEEQFSKPDGVAKFYGVFTANCVFNNTAMDLNSELFHKWVVYQQLVHEGTFRMYRNYIFQNRFDYNTRIYKLTLDPTRTYVLKASMCGAAFPIFTNTGNDANFNRDSPTNSDPDTVQQQFQCMGAYYRDPIVIVAFNRIVVDFNPYMHERYRDTFMVKIKPSEKLRMNNACYPRINMAKNAELEWWAFKDVYNTILKRSNDYVSA